LADFVGTKPFSCGDNLTYIDFTLFEVLDQMNMQSGGLTFKTHANLATYFKRIEQLPRFATYWEKDAMKEPYRGWPIKFD